MKKINLLGSTGSIGRQTLDIIRIHKDKFSLVACSGGRNIAVMRDIIRNFSPKLVAMELESEAEKLRAEFPFLKVISGSEGIMEVACYNDGDVVVNAVIGRVGLEPTLEAIKAGKDIALANKETLVIAGALVMEAARKKGVSIHPIDSEHSAIWQCIHGANNKDINKIILTASGGSFRNLKREQLDQVTVEDALSHPVWSMGSKITIDSATLMNKGLEVIEAHWLFNLPYERIDVVLHDESIVHSLVEFCDGSVLAQLGNPDMRIPIQYALTYPGRIPLPKGEPFSLAKIGALHFREVNFERFPCLKMAYDVGKTGGTMPTVLNAANEVAVSFFLAEKISFLEIENIITEFVTGHKVIVNPDLTTIKEVDSETRYKVQKKIEMKWS